MIREKFMTLCSGRMKDNIYLDGNWKNGWALDLHTLSSKKLGEEMASNFDYDRKL